MWAWPVNDQTPFIGTSKLGCDYILPFSYDENPSLIIPISVSYYLELRSVVSCNNLMIM